MAARHEKLRISCKTHFALLGLLFYFGDIAWTQTQHSVANEKSWRLVHIPRPLTTKKLPTLMQVADIGSSDAGLVGMMVHCSDQTPLSAFTTIFILADPFPPEANPEVSWDVSGSNETFEGRMIPTGAGVSVPIDIQSKMAGPWLKSSELNVSIKNQTETFKGVIQLQGLSESLKQLKAECEEN